MQWPETIPTDISAQSFAEVLCREWNSLFDILPVIITDGNAVRILPFPEVE